MHKDLSWCKTVTMEVAARKKGKEKEPGKRTGYR
jgi:hypothetical protein